MQNFHGQFVCRKERLTIIRITLFTMLCILMCTGLCSCKTEEGWIEGSPETANEDYNATGHILYGYKHGIMVYGQYMDQAGNNNAMILITITTEDNSNLEVSCPYVAINGSEVSTQIITKKLTARLTVMEIYLKSTIVEIDELNREDYVGIAFKINDKDKTRILEETAPITFPCNEVCKDN